MAVFAQRLVWLALFRGLAVLGMVWTHSAHTFLDARLRDSSWFHDLDYYHGLIAPAFFWIAGFVRAHVTTGKPRPAWPAVKRLLLVWLIGYLMSWVVCVPLGVAKALKHRSAFDTATSVAVFLGYAIPGFVACLVLLLLFATDLGWNWLPLGGFRSENVP